MFVCVCVCVCVCVHVGLFCRVANPFFVWRGNTFAIFSSCLTPLSGTTTYVTVNNEFNPFFLFADASF
jgi:hypothetical protein